MLESRSKSKVLDLGMNGIINCGNGDSSNGSIIECTNHDCGNDETDAYEIDNDGVHGCLCCVKTSF